MSSFSSWGRSGGCCCVLLWWVAGGCWGCCLLLLCGPCSGPQICCHKAEISPMQLLLISEGSLQKNLPGPELQLFGAFLPIWIPECPHTSVSASGSVFSAGHTSSRNRIFSTGITSTWNITWGLSGLLDRQTPFLAFPTFRLRSFVQWAWQFPLGVWGPEFHALFLSFEEVIRLLLLISSKICLEVRDVRILKGMH